MLKNSVHLRCQACRAVNKVPVHRLKDLPKCGKCKRPLQFSRKPIDVTDANYREEVLDFPGLVLLEFHAKWCGACRMMEPVLNALARQKAGILKVVKIDVDRAAKIASSFGITATPTFILYQNGAKRNQVAGALSIEQLEAWIHASIQ